MADIASLLGAAGLGGAIGQAIVRLELDTSKYTAEMKAAQAQTTAGANTMGSSVSKFGGLAKSAMLGAGVAFVAFGVAAVGAAVEAEKALAALKIAVGDNTEAYEAQGLALQKLTGFQDEQIMSAQAQLSRFDLTEQQILDLMPLVLDYAAVTGVEVPAAATNLGKALLGNTRALKTIGVEFTATGNRTKDYNTLVGLLAGSNIKGAASADTFAHSARVMSAQFDELAETAGAALIPALTGLLKAITPVLEQAAKLGAVFSSVGRVVEVLANPLGKLIDLMGGLHGHTVTLAEGLASDVDWIRTFAGEVRAGVPVVAELQGVTEALTIGVAELGGGVGEFGGVVEDAGEKVHRFAGMSREAFKDFRDSATSSLQDAGGALDGIREKWDLTAREAVRDMERMAEMARQMGRDFKALDRTAVPEKFKAFLINEGPAAVHAFVEGTVREKARFVAAWRQYEGATRTAVNNMEKIASGGGHQVGAAMIQGVIAGIHQLAGDLIGAAVKAVSDAMRAAEDAAEAHSASRRMMRLGRDMMLGLLQGLQSKEDAVVEAYERVVNKIISGLEKQASAFQERLSQLQSSASAFRGSVTGGFGSFADLFGGIIDLGGTLQAQQVAQIQAQIEAAQKLGDKALVETLTEQLKVAQATQVIPTGSQISGFAASQVAGAQQFADVLTALQTQGLSKQLLAQVAEAGPSGIPFAQSLLQMGPEGIAEINAAFKTIADLSTSTARGLSESYFGEKIDRVRDDLHEINASIHLLQEALENPRRVDIDDIHEGLLRKARRNGSLQLT